jgi:hypothetical protein
LGIPKQKSSRAVGIIAAGSDPMPGRDDAPATYFVLSLIALDVISEGRLYTVDDNDGSRGEESKDRALLGMLKNCVGPGKHFPKLPKALIFRAIGRVPGPQAVCRLVRF